MDKDVPDESADAAPAEHVAAEPVTPEPPNAEPVDTVETAEPVEAEPPPEAPAPEPQIRRRLAMQSPGFGVIARAAREAAAATPVLEDPYWVPKEEDHREHNDAKERLRKVAILVLSGVDEGMKLSDFMDRLEQLHPEAKNDLSLCNFPSEKEMIEAMPKIARIDQADGEERVFPLELAEDEFDSESEVVDGRMTLKLDRSSGAALGLSVAPDEEHGALEILEVSDGLVKEWCLKKPTRHVYKGDKIVAVNQMKGSSRRLVELLRLPGPLVLSLVRAPTGATRPRGPRNVGRGRPELGKGFKGKGRGREAPIRIPGAAAKSSFRRKRSPDHRRHGRSRSRGSRRSRRSGRRQASKRRRNSRRNASRSRDSHKEVRLTLEKISRRAICGVCMEHLGQTHGTLDLRKCGHPVHAQCLVGLERDEEGHPRCEACNFQSLHQISGKNSHSRKDKRRRSSRRKSRGRRKNKSSSSSRSDSSEGENISSSSEDSKPPGLLTAIRGTSRFCSECGQHMGWVEKLTPSAMQAAPKPLCESCAKKAQDKEKAEKVEKVEKAEVEEVMEVDEWGFQMAMDQVTEAACPEDATAVLEALLKSKPCEDFLKAGHWKNKLEELVKEEMSNPEQAARRAELVANLAQMWRRVLDPSAATAHSETTRQCASPEADVVEPNASPSAGDQPAGSETGNKEEAEDQSANGKQSAPPSASKGYLWELLQKARQKTKDKIAAALPLTRHKPSEARNDPKVKRPPTPPEGPKPTTAPWVGVGQPGSFMPPMYPWATATQPLPY